MPLSITDGARTVRLSGSDLPTKIPLPDQLASAPVELSDGTRLLASTGVTPGDIAITGTLRLTDSDGTTPYQKMQRLQQMEANRRPVTLTWREGRVGFTQPCLISQFQPAVIANAWIEYTLTLFIEVRGALSSGLGGSVGSPTPGQIIAANMNLMATLGPTAGAVVNATIQDALTALAAIPGGTNAGSSSSGAF